MVGGAGPPALPRTKVRRLLCASRGLCEAEHAVGYLVLEQTKVRKLPMSDE